MRHRRLRRSFLLFLPIATILMVGCGDSANLIGPSNQLEVTNALDQFQFQLTALDDVTDRRSYQWENTGTQATIDISQEITGGTAVLTIHDAAGTLVHSEDISHDNDTSTSVGVAGTWRIEVVLTGTTGTFNFRVQKVT